LTGRRGGDFEMWFWLITSAAILTSTSLTFSITSLAANGAGVNASVTLSGPAPAGGQTVNLSAVVSDPTHANIAGAVTMPPSVTIPAGATSAVFTLVPAPVTLTGLNPTTAQIAALVRTVIVTATSSAGTATAQLTLTPVVHNTHY